MAKHKPTTKGPEAAEASLTVEGKTTTGVVQEHGKPERTGQLVTVQSSEFSLSFPDTMTEPQFEEYCQKFGAALQGAAWRVGDVANFGKAKYGYKDYEKICDLTGLSEIYVRQCSSLAERVAPEIRHLASLERFRLMLPKNKVLVPATEDGKPATTKTLTPAELVAHFADWTAADLRRGHKEIPKQLAIGESASASSTSTQSATGGDSASSAADTGKADKTAEPVKNKGEMTATAIYDACRALQIGVELLTPDRLATLAVMEQKLPLIKPLSAMLKLLSDQIRTELNK